MTARRRRVASLEGFSALQRAEIAEISALARRRRRALDVSVLFNEPKLLKLSSCPAPPPPRLRFSALQRAEIAEIVCKEILSAIRRSFQCSSTSRNC